VCKIAGNTKASGELLITHLLRRRTWLKVNLRMPVLESSTSLLERRSLYQRGRSLIMLFNSNKLNMQIQKQSHIILPTVHFETVCMDH